MASVTRIPKTQQAQTVATILAIGTANPPTYINQSDYPDFFFRATKSEKSMVKKRNMYVTEDFLKDHPVIASYDDPSLNVRQKILVKEVPKLGMEAATKAIKEWAHPTSRLTHLIFCTSSGSAMPSADHQLALLLGLSPSIKRFMMYQQGCFAGAAALRLAKDLAENDRSARVLVVCSENMLCCFRAPRHDHLDVLVGSAIFSDGAGAIVVGADPEVSERPLFQLLSAKQKIIEGSEDGIVGHVREMGLAYYLSKKIPTTIGNNIVECFLETVEALGVTDYNSMFYVVHPGGPQVLKVVESRLGLSKERLKASWHVLTEYGNMWGPSVFFILDEMRKRSMEEGKGTTGEGKDLGVLFAFGPGVTVETILLCSVATE